MSSAFSDRSAMLPRLKAIGNITDSAAMTRRPLPSARSRPSAECDSPSRWPISCTRDRLDVEPIGVAALRRRPREERVEEDVRLEDAAVGGVDGERRRRQRAVLVGAVEEADHRRRRPGRTAGDCAKPTNSDDVLAVSTACHVAKPRPTAAWNCGALTRAGIGVGDEVSDRKIAPPQRQRPAVDVGAELQVRAERHGQRPRSARPPQQARGGSSTASRRRCRGRRPRRHRLADPARRTLRIGIGLRSTAPRRIGCASAVDAAVATVVAMTGGTTICCPVRAIAPDAEHALVQAEDRRPLLAAAA